MSAPFCCSDAAPGWLLLLLLLLQPLLAAGEGAKAQASQSASSQENTPPAPQTPHMLGVFGNGMVLQHNDPVIHGCGAPPLHAIAARCDNNGANVSVTRTIADEAGCFHLRLEPRPQAHSATADAVTVRVKLAVGNASSPYFAVARNVLYGTVILCAGQSNMVHPVSYDYNATAALAAAGSTNGSLRLFQVGRQWSNNGSMARSLPLGCSDAGTAPPLSPACAMRNFWRTSNNNSAASFSAVCYFTAQELMRRQLGQTAAVGLVEVDWGGSNQHPWQTHSFAAAYGCDVLPVADAQCPLEMKPLSPIGSTNYGCLFHGMVQPLAQSLRPALALWYQGEANANDAGDMFQCQLEAMVTEWRLAFNSSSLPFFLVQLAPYWSPPVAPVGYNYPHIRIAQAAAAQSLMNKTSVPSGFAVTHDIGDVAGGIHPHNKTEVGRRLSYEILSRVYGVQGLPRVSAATNAAVAPAKADAAVRVPEDVVRSRRALPSTPKPRMPQSRKVLVIQVHFSRGTTSLRWGPTHNCSACCNPQTRVVQVAQGTGWQNVSASCVAGDSGVSASKQRGLLRRVAASPAPTPPVLQAVVLGSSAGAAPNAVRFAWSNYPQCVLFDQNNLPVAPFSLDIASSATHGEKRQGSTSGHL